MSNTVDASALLNPRDSANALVEERLRSDSWAKIEALEQRMDEVPEEQKVVFPLRHIFTPGLYGREIYMFSGKLLTSRIHMFEHPFVVSFGSMLVRDDDNGWHRIDAPFTGITKPGTRRVIFTLTDVIMTTFHVTDLTDPDEIVRSVTYCDGKYAELRGAAAKELLEILPEDFR